VRVIVAGYPRLRVSLLARVRCPAGPRVRVSRRTPAWLVNARALLPYSPAAGRGEWVRRKCSV